MAKEVRGEMRLRCRFDARLAGSLGLILLVLILGALNGCAATVAPQSLKLDDLIAAARGRRETLDPGFNDFKVLTQRGKDAKSGIERGDEVVDHRSRTYVSRRRLQHWWVKADLVLFSSEKAARERLIFLCDDKYEPLVVDELDPKTQICKSMITQSRNDPEGLWLASDQYLSRVYLRQGSLLVLLEEAFYGAAETRKKIAISDITDRLKRCPPLD